MASRTSSDPVQLLCLARLGEGETLGQLLELYRGYLTMLARLGLTRRLQGKVEPADLVQDVFLEAHRHFAGFQGNSEAELVGWLRQILAARLANTVRHYLGTRQRDVRLERDLAGELDQSSRVLAKALMAPQSTPSQRAVRREQVVLLADALERLPADYREVIVLRHLQELPFAEVAARMDRSAEAVKKLWTRALTKLRGSLGGAS